MDDAILVADIGGTNARFAMARHHGGSVQLSDIKILAAREFATLQDGLNAYIDIIGTPPSRGCFAVAAPCNERRIAFTNSTWSFSPQDFKSDFGFSDFHVVNDFYALAQGAASLPETAFLPIKEGKPECAAPTLLIGPGTGLGQALIVPAGAQGLKQNTIISTEGGHVDFAPQTDEEMEVRQRLKQTYDRVSVEHLISGPGLANIYRALCEIGGRENHTLEASQITAAALDGSDPVAERALEMFCTILGRAAGNAVLATGARGGVVLGGGILPKLRDFFFKSMFVQAFEERTPMNSYVADVPVRMIIDEKAALYGAAIHIN